MRPAVIVGLLGLCMWSGYLDWKLDQDESAHRSTPTGSAGYSPSDVEALGALVGKSKTRSEQKAERVALYTTKASRDAAIAYLYGGGR